MDSELLFSAEILQFMQPVDNENDDKEIDSLLLATSETFERNATASTSSPKPVHIPTSHAVLPQSDPGPVPVPYTSPTHSGVRFAQNVTDEEIEHARERAVPAKTVADTKYCIGLFEAWRKHRMETTNSDIPTMTDMTTHEMQYWLTRFVLEVRKKSGEVYPPNSLHHITVGIMRHVRCTGQPGLDFFKNPEFVDFQKSLDAKMKRLQQLGVGSTRKQAETLTEAEEDSLWEKGLLGDHTPQTFWTPLYFIMGTTLPLGVEENTESLGIILARYRWLNILERGHFCVTQRMCPRIVQES